MKILSPFRQILSRVFENGVERGYKTSGAKSIALIKVGNGLSAHE
jgi:hypothetical protein